MVVRYLFHAFSCYDPLEIRDLDSYTDMMNMDIHADLSQNGIFHSAEIVRQKYF